MFPLDKSPRGLLELFRLRTNGSQPPQFGEAVLPVVEVEDFYSGDLKRLSGAGAGTGALTGVGQLSSLTLTGPVRVHSIGARLTIGAAAATNVTICVELADAVANMSLGSTFFAALNAAAIAGHCWVPARPIVLLPWNNMRLRARASGTAAGVDHSVQLMALIDNITGTS